MSAVQFTVEVALAKGVNSGYFGSEILKIDFEAHMRFKLKFN